VNDAVPISTGGHGLRGSLCWALPLKLGPSEPLMLAPFGLSQRL
jgi:hypothetical protein